MSQPGAVKEGVPSDYELECLSKELSWCWRNLGRRLKFKEPRLDGFDHDKKTLDEKAYSVLMAWKQRDFSQATYRVLREALCILERRDLAETYCT